MNRKARIGKEWMAKQGIGMPDDAGATLGDLMLGESPIEVSQRPRTPEQLGEATLNELRRIREKVSKIASWVIFFGWLVLITIALGVFVTCMGMGLR